MPIAAPPANRLADAPSPYLQQHRDDPVAWWPWCEAAFAEARRRDVPVFLSIGYSTCHWCHVMAHESFQDPDVARVLNDAFVCIKVDREERPDVDAVYMRACQAMTGSGGWPLTVFTTPDKRPFLAGTYFPKRARFGRIGIVELADRVQEAWRARRGDLEHQADHIAQALAQEAPGGRPGWRPGMELLERAAAALHDRFDAQHGGFGGPPKFPTPHTLRFLLQQHARGDANALPMVRRTLDCMLQGGVHDHLGGGFHRYSTDARWFLPHFEKMLHDQAGMLAVLAQAHAATGAPAYRDAALGVASYMQRDLRHADGAFFAAEDADSEGEEGLFYTWRRDEVADVLEGGPVGLFCDAYGVHPDGNFDEEATGRPSGRNVLHRARPLEEVAAQHALDPGEASRRLADCRRKLLAARTRRVRPLRDEKVLTDWNGLAVSALARASVLLEDARLADMAAQAARFLSGNLRTPDGSLRHRFKDGAVDDRSFLDDHAFLCLGLLDLHAATQEVRWLREARGVAAAMVERFTANDGGFHLAEDGDGLPARPRDAYDGALPSGNSVAVEVLWRLGRLTGEARWEEAAWTTASAFAGELEAHPAAFCAMLCGLDAALGPAREVVVAGPREDPRTQALLDAARRGLPPGVTVLLHDPEGDLAGLCPWVAPYRPVAGRPAAYVCRDHACRAPVTDVQGLERALAA